jgi:hypothetical protein
VRRDNTAGGGGTRRNSEDVVMVEQPAAREHQAPYFSGFLARYRSSLQEGRSLADGAEDSSGYWRFDVEGSVEVNATLSLAASSSSQEILENCTDGLSNL